MPKSILVASDLSVRSERALRRAFMLARVQDAALTVLSIVDQDLPERIAARTRETAMEELELLCQAIDADLEVTLLVEIADPLQGILAVVKRIGADLLVLGTHRERPVWDLFYGTTMERIVRASSLPVLLVHDAPLAPYGKVLCGIDMSPACAAALTAAAAIAPAAQFRTFHAVHIPYRGLIARSGHPEALEPFLTETRSALRDWWDKTDLPEGCACPDPVAAGRTELMTRLLDQEKPDLVAMGAHGRSPLSPTLLGGFTEQTLREPPTDILVTRR
ncbi:universal stress protein [Oceanicola sp. S124]|uniref:universal stress protein n=1 Tax=Oceanicola sp. S124 TaxID=1042378 RepID=UPI00025579A8|nr:universal stress protein [Oceanicola sp. S124]